MRETRIRQLEQTNREQRETIERLQKMNLETKMSLYQEFVALSMMTESNDPYKVMHMQDKINKTITELWGDLKEELFVENDEKIIELPHNRQTVR